MGISATSSIGSIQGSDNTGVIAPFSGRMCGSTAGASDWWGEHNFCADAIQQLLSAIALVE